MRIIGKEEMNKQYVHHREKRKSVVLEGVFHPGFSDGFPFRIGFSVLEINVPFENSMYVEL